jgi:hypothetical protein
MVSEYRPIAGSGNVEMMETALDPCADTPLALGEAPVR